MNEEFKDPPKEFQALLKAHRDWVESEAAEGQQLTDERLRERELTGLRLDGACFRMAKLHDVAWVHCSMVGTDFGLADLQGNVFRSCNMRNAVLDEAELDLVVITDDSQIEGASFNNAATELAKIPGMDTLIAASAILGPEPS